MALVATVSGILGAFVGSFLNLVVYRLPRGESVVKPRSRCPGCGAAIAGRDNVPMLSWLVLRGRCRGCGARISARYPAVELLTALVFAAVASIRGLDADLLLELPFAAMLAAVAFIDLEHRIVPNRILLPAAVWALVVSPLVRPDQLIEILLAGVAALTFLLVSAVVYPAGMGMGDVKLAGVMGLYLGAAVAPALFFGFAAGALLGVVLMLRDGMAARKVKVPFGPFLALGGLVGLLVGPQLLALYLSTFSA